MVTLRAYLINFFLIMLSISIQMSFLLVMCFIIGTSLLEARGGEGIENQSVNEIVIGGQLMEEGVARRSLDGNISGSGFSENAVAKLSVFNGDGEVILFSYHHRADFRGEINGGVHAGHRSYKLEDEFNGTITDTKNIVDLATLEDQGLGVE